MVRYCCSVLDWVGVGLGWVWLVGFLSGGGGWLIMAVGAKVEGGRDNTTRRERSSTWNIASVLSHHTYGSAFSFVVCGSVRMCVQRGGGERGCACASVGGKTVMNGKVGQGRVRHSVLGRVADVAFAVDDLWTVISEQLVCLSACLSLLSGGLVFPVCAIVCSTPASSRRRWLLPPFPPPA